MKRRSTHGDTGSPEYKIWEAMKHRCYNPNNAGYANYGGRGITVCDRWRDSYANFLADMGRRPSSKHSIDRRDNDGPYSLDNCKWATRIEQSNNRRSNAYLTIDGTTQTISQWIRAYGVTNSIYYSRIKRGMSPIDALETPVRKHKVA